MLIKNVKFQEDSNENHSIYINDEGIIECIDCNNKDGEVIDAKGRLISKPFVNPHAHLGYALTLNYARHNLSGTLIEGVEIIREEVSQKITQEDLEKRLEKIIKIHFINGIFYVRSHDPVWNDVVFKMLKARNNPLVDIQVVAFPSPGFFFDENVEKIRKALEEGAEVVGLIPHSERSYEEGIKSIKVAFDLAVEYNKLIDGHVDETDDPNSRFSEVVAREALSRGIGYKTSISHMTASHSYDNWYFHKLSLLLREAGVSIISNPIVSTHLQGRYDNYPKRRGVARIRELINAGVNVALGSDNVADPIYPLGDYNMLRVAQEAFLADHFTSNEIEELLNLITTNAYKAMQLKEPEIKSGNKAEFIILQTKTIYDAIRTALPPFLVVRGKHYAINEIKTRIDENEETDKIINIIDK
ncbi:MAG: amidohydrolase family protein [Acidianus hospitalis]